MADTSQPAFAEIAEADATGCTAEIYADFRASIGLPMVNLIYRHMATTPGCLEWAWAHLRPHFVGGAFAAEAERIIAGLALPEGGGVTGAALAEAGIDAAAQADITRTLETYNRANPMNLVAMAVLARELGDPASEGRVAPTETSSAAPGPARDLPPMADLAALPDETRAVLGVLAAQAGTGGTAVVPSLYRHFADRPRYLALAAATIAPIDNDGSLARSSEALCDAARRAARNLPRYAIAVPPPAENQRRNLLGLIDLFPTAIGRMVVIGVYLRRSMP